MSSRQKTGYADQETGPRAFAPSVVRSAHAETEPAGQAGVQTHGQAGCRLALHSPAALGSRMNQRRLGHARAISLLLMYIIYLAGRTQFYATADYF